MKLLFFLTVFVFILSSEDIYSQEVKQDTTLSSIDDFDFSEMGNADEFEVKTYCTQKVPGLSPTQLISVGYESQMGFPFETNGAKLGNINKYRGLRLAFNAPVISRSNFILNLGVSFWNTSVGLESKSNNTFINSLERGLNTTGVNATIFKPLNDKHFIIAQINLDANGNYNGISDLNLSKSLTYSGIGVFGWKKDEKTMFGVGLTRTYRAGQVLHLPAIYYNKTFNNNWGLESVFPARLNLRRNFGSTGLLLLGYEIEGNTFYLNDLKVNNQDVFLRRGELKPRVNYQRKIIGFVWLSAQAGLRYNWRFKGFTTQNPTGDNIPLIDNTLGNPLYFNISLNLVSP